ncbi:YqhV family protein [Desulfitibacter alkalitolerans]|uniref:YqhV family protein n=1 Tax=Desulfitibacter alkalitolerans TaxID=264641 RepID=UPI000488E914|nr:YqhV family protein [Desulfitibacter alkalitolerans]
MFFIKEKIVVGMALIRILSCMIELSAAILMLKFNKVETALKINAVLAFIGPLILMSVMALGLFGVAGKMPSSKMFFIILGVLFIFYGASKG